MLPHELVSRYVTPYLRGLVAFELVERGLNQLRISRLLGVTQPMVYRYLKMGREELLRRLEEAGVPRGDAVAIARGVAVAAIEGGRARALAVFASAVNRLLRSGALCELHRKVDPDIPPSCSICRELFAVLPEDEYVASVSRAVELIESDPRSWALVPEVGMNVAEARPGAAGPEDVVAVPGRIVRVGRSVKAVGEPRYGCSRYLAQLILTVMKRFPELRSVINVRFSEELVEELRRRGLRIVEVGPYRSPDEIFVLLERELSRLSKPPDAIIDRGGMGIEPNVYLLGRTAVDAARRALDLLR